MSAKTHKLSSPRLQPFSTVILRAVVVAMTLGSVLAAVNQWEGIFGINDIDYLSLTLVYCTPFIVVTISQIVAFRQANNDARLNVSMTIKTETFTRTMVSHGIPMRAVQIGLAMGAINTTLVLGPAFQNPAHEITVPYLLMGQAFTLPVVFGILSQAISYRRALRAFELQSTYRPTSLGSELRLQRKKNEANT